MRPSHCCLLSQSLNKSLNQHPDIVSETIMPNIALIAAQKEDALRLMDKGIGSGVDQETICHQNECWQQHDLYF